MIKTRKNLLPVSTFWELNGSSFEQTWISFTQRCFVPIWLKLVRWFSRKRWKCEKFITTTTTTTDNGQILIRKAHLILWLRWAKKFDPAQFLLIFNDQSTSFSKLLENNSPDEYYGSSRNIILGLESNSDFYFHPRL